MDRLTLDLRQIDRVDVQKLGFPLTPAAPRHPLGALERAALKSALSFGKSANPQLGLALEAIGVADRRPVVTILPPTPTVTTTTTSKFPVSISTKTDLTVAVGMVGSFFNVGGASIEGGVYGSTTREIGVYLTVGIGIFTNVGASVGANYTFILGTPGDFSGPYIAVSASGGPEVGAVGVTLLFLPALPFVFMGLSISFTVGPSTLPVTFAVEVTDTEIEPLIKF